MERENVLEIEIVKVNDKYSAFWVTKKDKSILGLERQALIRIGKTSIKK